jgi:hypothetical protein
MGVKFTLKQVRYLPEHELSHKLEAIADELSQNFDPELACDPLFMKRRAFVHEAEVRAVAYVPPDCILTSVYGVPVPVNPHTLIQSVLVDPRAPKEFVSTYKYFLREKLGYRGRVAQSELYADTEPLEVL